MVFMKKFSLLCVALLLFATLLQAQNWQWAKSAGGTSFEIGRGIAVDGSGNVYATGYYTGTVAFGTTSITSAGGEDLYIAKYDASGNLLWVKSAGGTANDRGLSVDVDTSGNTYVTGICASTATFGSTTVTAAGGSDIVVAKYNSMGDVLWVNTAGGAFSDDYGYGVAVSASGSVYIAGRFEGTIAFGATNIISAGGQDVFIAKYSNSGSLSWVKRAGGAGLDFASAIALDANGNPVITGSFADFSNPTATFESTTITTTGMRDVFIAKYDTTGGLIWVKKAGGSGNDQGNGISVDGFGNCYVSGYLSNGGTFGSTTLTALGSVDGFVSKFDGSGNSIWAKIEGGSEGDYGYAVSADAMGNVYNTGWFTTSGTFGGTSVVGLGFEDIYVTKYDSAGTLLWAKSAGGAGVDQSYAIASDASGNAYLTGSFGKSSGLVSATFGNIVLNSIGIYDVYVAKIGSAVTSVGRSALPSLNIYPNPNAGKFTVEAEGYHTLIINDFAGREVYRSDIHKGSHTIDLGTVSHGIYYVRAMGNSGYKVNKIVVE